MKILHVAPGDSAGGTLAKALRSAGRDDEVLRYHDDLSCGPIDSDDPSVRAAWWSRFYDEHGMKVYAERFWDRAATSAERLIVWFDRHSAQELTFFLAWAHRMGDRPYDVVDVTGQAERLRTLFGSERPLSVEEKAEARRQWQRLREQNAPFRIVTPAGLVSAPIDHFDPFLLKRANADWQTSVRIIVDTIAYNFELYGQVRELMLLTRIVALIGEGKLLADGDPWDMFSCRVRVPG